MYIQYLVLRSHGSENNKAWQKRTVYTAKDGKAEGEEYTHKDMFKLKLVSTGSL